ncbi:MAG: hypothetical protein ACPGXK_16400, partial [Phycisphaerae bacterium]
MHELRNLPEGWLGLAGLLLIAGLCWAVIWMYRREGRMGASPGTRLFLGVVRSLVLVLLAVILLEPVRVRILRRWIDSYTIVLVDDSSSMGLADRYRNSETASQAATLTSSTQGEPVSRQSLVQSLLDADEGKFLADLAENNRVKVYRFSDTPEHVATIRARREQKQSSTGDDAG